ncbi:putative hydrolase [uncultured Alphaproteobacteria bacterium]|uniref:Putative hydrolase n=1 Tax=uncultured Alphaproteobacteria bacterium TaxID=91750 RepID=A0A212KLZ2_9PROT|nr:putative hydrolase [uncultured Alphaproteobacteria bacterium]
MRAALEAWIARCAADAVLRRAAAGLSAAIGVSCVGEPPVRLRLGDGEPCGEVTIAAAPAAWERLFAEAAPAPGWQSFGAILRLNPAFTVIGAADAVAVALAVLERMIELARPAAEPLPAPPAARDYARVEGRFVEIAGPGGRRWLSTLVAGEGPPLLFLHTAGGDGRQFLHQLADLGLGAAWRMHAFDLPGHGRSGATPGWSEGAEYRLSLADYRDWCVAYLEQAVGEPAVVAGCSMGAAMALTLAAERPDLVRGVAAFEAPWRAPGRRTPLLADARVNPQLHNAAYVRALLGPLGPQSFRDEACWIYSQAGFGVYLGDLWFYSEEFDGAAIAPRLAENATPIHLLTGAYDYSAPPASSRTLAAAIGHATFTEMPGLGHFPMIEHPDAFRPYLAAALDDIRARTS